MIKYLIIIFLLISCTTIDNRYKQDTEENLINFSKNLVKYPQYIESILKDSYYSKEAFNKIKLDKYEMSKLKKIQSYLSNYKYDFYTSEKILHRKNETYEYDSLVIINNYTEYALYIVFRSYNTQNNKRTITFVFTKNEFQGWNYYDVYFGWQSRFNTHLESDNE